MKKFLLGMILSLLSIDTMACTIQPLSIHFGTITARSRDSMQQLVSTSINCPTGTVYSITTQNPVHIFSMGGNSTALQLFKTSSFNQTDLIYNNNIIGTGSGVDQNINLYVQLSGDTTSSATWKPLGTVLSNTSFNTNTASHILIMF